MKKISIFIISAMLLSMLAAFSVSAAGDPGMIIDFSDNPILESVSGDMDYNFINDGDARVMEVISMNYDDAENKGGDPNNQFKTEDFIGDGATLDADKYQWMKIELKNFTEATKFEMHFGGDKIGIAAECCTHFDISANDTEYKTYIINIKDQNKLTFPVHQGTKYDGTQYTNDFTKWEDTSCWTGNINIVRFDYAYVREPGGMIPNGTIMNVKYAAFFETKEDAEAWTYTPVKTAADYQPKETVAPTTTEAPATTVAADTTVDETTQNNETTTGSNDSADGGNNMIIWIIIAAAAIIVIVVIIVVVSSKGKKK